MPAVVRRPRYLGAVAALAAVGIVAVTPITSVSPVIPRPAATPVGTAAVRLVAEGDSLLNIPFNLFQAIANIPSTEVEALNTHANSLFFTGSWFAASATDLWGEDPGDPGHFTSLINLLIPFKQISGLGAPEIDPVADAAGTAGLGQQLALLAAAELPASASCDADWCSPLYPTTTITGFSPIDYLIWTVAILTGQQRFPLINDWFQVPLSDLTSGRFTFGDVVNPSSGVGPGGSVLDDEVFGYPGTITGPDGQNLMPWSDITFKFDPFAPFESFYHSLLAPPNPAGVEFPSLAEIGRALQSFLAATVVGFNPFVPGTIVCWGSCDVPHFMTTHGIVQAIGNAWPGNMTINHWLDLAANGMANGSTQHQIDFAVQFIQGPQMVFDLGNPPPSEVPSWVETPAPLDISPLMAGVIQLAKDTGVQGFAQVLADLVGFEPAF